MKAIFNAVLAGYGGVIMVAALGPALAEDTAVSLPPAVEMTQAEVFFYHAIPVADCLAVVVLCPGQNGDGQKLLKEASWREFAEKHRLALAGIRFVSPNEILEKKGGYFDAAAGAGALLEEALRRQHLEDKPLLMLGFSGGAHFVNTFVQWAPGRVRGWCAQAAAWWKSPPAQVGPPGIIACGEWDGSRYGASLEHFQAGRRLGQPWSWVSVPEQGHRRSGDLEEFVRAYFLAVLATSPEARSPVLADTVTRKRIAAVSYPGASVWLPDATVYDLWAALHQP